MVAVHGLVQKLASLGVPLTLPGAAIAATWVYTFMLIGMAIVAAGVADSAPQPESRLRRALVWKRHSGELSEKDRDPADFFRARAGPSG